MEEWEIGDFAICINNSNMSPNGIPPPLKLSVEYTILDIKICKCGVVYLDVGISHVGEYLNCNNCGIKILNQSIWWCSSKRFIKRRSFLDEVAELEEYVMEIKDELEDKPNIVFGYFVNNEFKGFRLDSFGSIGKKFAKIYKYTPKQIEIIRQNTKYELSKGGGSFMKLLFNKEGYTPINTQSQILNKDEVILQVTKSEEEKRNWGEFEIRVLSFPYSYDDISGDEWKMKTYINNLPEPLEILKFKTVTDEN